MKKLLAILIFMPLFSYSSEGGKTPVVVITDLYHPYQDPGDNLDLIMGYSLPEIDLKAIILDITDHFRKKVADHPTLWKDPHGPREAGIIPVAQLNYIYNRNVPFAVGPLTAMRSETDEMLDISPWEEQGIALLMRVLKESPEPVEILSFGSARILAVAYNRNRKLLEAKIKKIHLSAGMASHGFAMGADAGANGIPGGEWNVALDVFAFTRLLRSDLPIAIYPCAGRDGAFVKDINNTYWQLPDVSFIKGMHPKLQRYLSYAFLKTLRYDFLRAMDDETFVLKTDSFPAPFHIWETAIWMIVSKRKLLQSTAGDWVLATEAKGSKEDNLVSGELRNCKLIVHDDGRFDFELVNTRSNFSIYYRRNPALQEKALQKALPALYHDLKID